jgi:phosphopantothenoylcysteine decarboxylase/phosphopantothenate--cysteine ligase
MNIPQNLLSGKKVLVGVTGSISAYKALELVRLFIKSGCEVKVVMSEAAKRFVTPLSFETLSRNVVLHEETESWAGSDINMNNHIKVGEWADLFVIAPCTANTIGKLANAIADNLVLQCALAYPDMKLLAPAANTNMMNNPLIQGSLKILKVTNYEVLETQVKDLACATTGDGALAEPLDIFYASVRELLKEKFWSQRLVMVTGGGTIEKIDDVRYLSNFSSGKMASSLALALYLKGADVNLIATKFDNELPSHIHTIEVESATEMHEYLVDSIRIAKKGQMSKVSIITDESLHLIQKEPYLFMAAAVSDYAPTHPQEGKLKKSMLGETWDIKLKQNIDILNATDRTGVKTVAFKAEMDINSAKQNAVTILDAKNVEAVCLNVLKDSSSFGTDDNAIEIITKNGVQDLGSHDKLTLSLKIVDASKNI